MAESLSNPKHGAEADTIRGRSQVSSFSPEGSLDPQVQLYSFRLMIARHYLGTMPGAKLDMRA
jgi:hypothetical protein